MSTNISQLPSDKTPAQRAQIKLYEQFALVFLVNAALAAYVLLSSYTTGQKPNWAVVIIAAVAQGVIALFNVLEKYFSAKNEPLYSAFVEAGRQEVLSKASPVPYSTTDQALQQAANAALDPSQWYAPITNANATAATPMVAPQNAAVPPALRPTVLQPIPADTPPVQPVSVPNTPPVNAVPLSTIPAMPVVQPQQ